MFIVGNTPAYGALKSKVTFPGGLESLDGSDMRTSVTRIMIERIPSPCQNDAKVSSAHAGVNPPVNLHLLAPNMLISR